MFWGSGLGKTVTRCHGNIFHFSNRNALTGEALVRAPTPLNSLSDLPRPLKIKDGFNRLWFYLRVFGEINKDDQLTQQPQPSYSHPGSVTADDTTH